jgi:phosphatidate cytidylyltransferase
LLVVLGGRPGVSLIAAALSLGMLWEYLALILKLPDAEEKRNVLLGTTWLICFLNFWMPRVEFEILVITFLGVMSYFLFTVGRHAGSALEDHFREWVYSFFGLFYVAFIPLYLPLLHDAGAGSGWVLLFFFIIWSSDTGAYFAGKKYGKRKLFPVISPKKTWEGFYGGLAAAVAVSLLAKLTFFTKMNWLATFAVPLFVGAVAPVGDLAESFLKRAFHVKDSGNVLPGHGGILDRFDAVLFALPVMLASIRIFG